MELPHHIHPIAAKILIYGGGLLLLVGIVVGSAQVVINYSLWAAHARGVTIDTLYAILFFWLFWCATATGYSLAGFLLPHKPRAATIGAAGLAGVHLATIALVLLEIAGI